MRACESSPRTHTNQPPPTIPFELRDRPTQARKVNTVVLVSAAAVHVVVVVAVLLRLVLLVLLLLLSLHARV